MWVDISGYKYRYRINDDGIVQKYDGKQWVKLEYSTTTKRAEVRLLTVDGKRKHVPVVHLMAQAFLGGYKRGMTIIHKNRVKTDNSLNNLQIVTQSEASAMADGMRKPVEMVDHRGEVVNIFRSGKAASEANYISRSAVSKRCKNMLKDPYQQTGYTFRFEK